MIITKRCATKLTPENMGKIMIAVNKAASKYFAKYNGIIPYEELLSEGLLVLVQCLHLYDENKGTMSTYLYRALENGLTSYCMKWITTIPQHRIDSFDSFEKIQIEAPEKSDWLVNFMDSLSSKGQHMVTVALSLKPKNIQHLKRQMRELKWRWEDINKTVKEVKTALSERRLEVVR